MTLNSNQLRVIALTEAYRKELADCCGGLCHIVCEDDNLDNESLDFCLESIALAKQGLRKGWNRTRNVFEYTVESYDFTAEQYAAMQIYLTALKAIPESDREFYD